ncbi:MAG: hypothetical protein AAF483_07525 [Planctomycetota bacterium]
MNWTVMIVVTLIALLIPAALFVTFVVTKDTHQYAQHYGANGFSQEVQNAELTTNELETSDVFEAEPSNVDPPLSEGPRDL